jgi:membrane protein YdbS with pleckstrin-like domain
MHKFNPNPIVAAVGYFIMAIFLSLALYFFREYIGEFFLLAVAIVWLMALIKVSLRYAHAKFELITLDENSMKYTRGILFQKNIILPYAKVTEAKYAQTPLQRIFGVGTLNVDSAGGAAVAIHVFDVNKSDIELIIKEINEKSGKDDGA